MAKQKITCHLDHEILVSIRMKFQYKIFESLNLNKFMTIKIRFQYKNVCTCIPGLNPVNQMAPDQSPIKADGALCIQIYLKEPVNFKFFPKIVISSHKIYISIS